MSLEGRVALVTGSSRRIGRAVALGLAADGADVAIHYHRSHKEGGAAVQAVEELGRRSFAIQANLARPEACRRVVETVAREFGRLDILVNNVGHWLVKSVSRMTLSEWRDVVDSNLTATFLCSKAAIPHMRRRRWGRIVNLGAAGAYRAHGTAKMSAFYAAKAGIVAFSKALAREVGRDGITVNVVAPSIIGDTNLTVEQARKQKEPKFAVQRPGTAADVVGAVRYLTSEEASFVTGEVLGVTGGWLL